MQRSKLALLAASMLTMAAGAAHAARVMDMSGNPSTVTGTGLVTTPDGFPEMGGPYTGGQGLETETQSPFSEPQPGTINMRINLEANEFPMAAWWTGMNGNGTPGSNAGNKQGAFGVYGWIRLDFGIDGQSRNGIKYGAFTEIRENNTTSIGGSSGTTVTSGFGQSASADASDNTLYVRQANVYIGTDHAGYLRMGTGLGAQSMFETGLMDDFDLGGWNMLDSATNVPNNISPIWPWADDGGEYMAARMMYVSPVLYGFDFGIAFAPNDSTPFDGSGCSESYGGVGCATQSSSTLAGDYGRYRNELGIALRYRNNFGPVGMAISGIYTTSGQVDDASAVAQPYKGLNIGDVGASVEFNRQFEIGGNVMWGAYNGSWGLQPVGGASAVAWVAGAKYTILQLPMTLGFNFFDYKNQGQIGLPTQRTEQGLDVGAVYGLGPGVALVAEYLWGQRYQGDYNFLTGAYGSESGANLDNKVQVQIATVGMSVRF
jgi:Gram-negative porin